MLEKAKQTLEAENADLATELKSSNAARADGERRRKQTEAQLAEMAAKLQEIERARWVINRQLTLKKVYRINISALNLKAVSIYGYLLVTLWPVTWFRWG